jgi:hypothetical protein
MSSIIQTNQTMINTIQTNRMVRAFIQTDRTIIVGYIDKFLYIKQSPNLVAIMCCPNLEYIYFEDCSKIMYVACCPMIRDMVLKRCKFLPYVLRATYIALIDCPNIDWTHYNTANHIHTIECTRSPTLPTNTNSLSYLNIDRCKKLGRMPQLNYMCITREWINCFHGANEPHTRFCYLHTKKITTIQRMMRTILLVRKIFPKCLRQIIYTYLYA